MSALRDEAVWSPEPDCSGVWRRQDVAARAGATYRRHHDAHPARGAVPIIGDDAGAIADAGAAPKLDPSSIAPIDMLAKVSNDRGKRDEALAMVQARIDAGGESKSDLITVGPPC
jgi:hypothetical protein